MKRKNIIIAATVVIAVAFVGIFGGAFLYEKANPSVKIDKGLFETTVFIIGDESCEEDEFNVMLYDMKKQYDELYGTVLWEKDIADISAKQFLEQKTLNQLAVYKCINLLAKDKKIYLNATQKTQAEKYAKEYISKFSAADIKKIGITEKGVVKIFEQRLLYDKVFESLTTTVNEEISVDEARVIKIQYIHVPLSEKTKIDSFYEKVTGGDSFEKIASENNGEQGYECLLTRGSVEEVFENAAFELGQDEISSVVTTTKGYYIIKCINDYEKTATQSNKQIILNDRKNKLFSQIYEEYVGELYYRLNDEFMASYEFDAKYEAKTGLNEIE